MAAVETASTKYVFFDIVSYSFNRTVEAQTDIIGQLNDITSRAIEATGIEKSKIIFLPTGDGICVALLDINTPFDVDICLALKILEFLSDYNASQKEKMKQFQIRVGLNENVGNIVVDINKSQNLAGAGINSARRVMDNADAGNILIGQSVYDRLSPREKYFGKFKRFVAIVKHNQQFPVYQFVDSATPYLNSNIPEIFLPKIVPEPRFSKLVAYLFAHIIKNKQFIEKYRGSGQHNYALFQLMIFLAMDSVAFSESSPFQRPSSKLPATKSMALDEMYNYFMGIHFWTCCEFVSIFKELKIWQNWDGKYFVPNSYELEINYEGRAKLKSEWPEIVKELNLEM